MSVPALSLSSEASRALREGLDDFCAEADLRYAAVLQDAGMVLAECGDAACRDQGETGAIATGAFFASQALAQRLGEGDFSGLHYEGRQRHFFIASVTTETLVLCVFGNETKIAIVRACARRHLPRLAAALRRMQAAPLELGDLSLGASSPLSERGNPFAALQLRP